MEIYIVWGFLGSGKTTFINNLLSVYLYNKKVVILENESGQESVDGILLRSKNYIVKDMKAGCVCCSLRNELPLTIQNIQDEIKPDILLIEPAGISSLEDLIRIPYLKVNQVITMVDVANYHLLMKLNSHFYKRQYSLSSIMLLTKTDLVEGKQVKEIINELMIMNPSAFICANYHEIGADMWNDLFNYQTKHFIPVYNLIEMPTYKIETISIKKHISLNQINEIFNTINCSSIDVIRAKGFVLSTDLKILKIDYVCGKLNVKEMPADFKINDYFLSFWYINTEVLSLSSIVDSYF